MPLRRLIRRSLPFAALVLAVPALPATATERPSLVYDDGARHACFLHIGQTKKRVAGGKRLIINDLGASQCAGLPDRSRFCRRGRMWPDTEFAREGVCPAWFVQTHDWLPDQRLGEGAGGTGWDFRIARDAEDAPLLMTLSNNTAGVDDACAHHEINFNYNFPGQSFRRLDNRPLRLGDAEDVRFSFEGRVTEATPSRCARLPRSLVKLSVVLRWYDRTVRPARYLAQTSIAVILFDRDGLMDRIQTRQGVALSEPVTFDNRCTANRVYASARACMITLDGPDVDVPTMDGTMRRFDIPITALAERFRDRLEPVVDGRRLRVEDAEFKSVQVISAVNGSDLTFQLREPRLTGEVAAERLD